MSKTVESLIAYCHESGRVCPLPPTWNRLWEMLAGRLRVGAGWQPLPPLILAAWHDTPATLKMTRLAGHIEWAGKRRSLEAVGKFVRGLGEDDWFHIGE